MPSKFSLPVTAGDHFEHRTAGAGGWGDALRRDPAAVAADVRNEILSVERALAAYGVVIDPASGDVHVDATAVERARSGARRADA
jgi:N-methylhydantoinase B